MKTRKREPVIFVDHHHFPRPEEVLPEDIARIGRHCDELIARARQAEAQRAEQEQAA